MYPLLSECFVKENIKFYGCHSDLIIKGFTAKGMQIAFLARKLENAPNLSSVICGCICTV